MLPIIMPIAPTSRASDRDMWSAESVVPVESRCTCRTQPSQPLFDDDCPLFPLRGFKTLFITKNINIRDNATRVLPRSDTDRILFGSRFDAPLPKVLLAAGIFATMDRSSILIKRCDVLGRDKPMPCLTKTFKQQQYLFRVRPTICDSSCT